MRGKTLLLSGLFAGLIAGAYFVGLEKGRNLHTDSEDAATKQYAASSTDKIPAIQPPAGSFTHFRVGNRNVKALLAEDDRIWAGTSGGLIRYLPQSDEYRHFDVRSGLLANAVFHVSRWSDEKMLIGTYGGGLAVYDETADEFEIFNIPDGLADAFVYDVLQMPDGDLWIATWSGANLVRGGRLDDPDAWQTYTVKNTGNGLPNNWVYAIEAAADGAVWFATEGGLARLQDGKWSNWDHRDGQGADYELVKNDNTFNRDPATVSSHHARQKIEMGLEDVDTAYNPNYIVALEIDRHGTVWAGTWGGGLARFDGEHFINYTVRDGLPSNHVFMLRENADGSLWVGTSHGLVRYDGDRFSAPLTVHDGLFSNTVFSMDIQDSGVLWIGSFGGVTRLTF